MTDQTSSIRDTLAQDGFYVVRNRIDTAAVTAAKNAAGSGQRDFPRQQNSARHRSKQDSAPAQYGVVRVLPAERPLHSTAPPRRHPRLYARQFRVARGRRKLNLRL